MLTLNEIARALVGARHNASTLTVNLDALTGAVGQEGVAEARRLGWICTDEFGYCKLTERRSELDKIVALSEESAQLSKGQKITVDGEEVEVENVGPTGDVTLFNRKRNKRSTISSKSGGARPVVGSTPAPVVGSPAVINQPGR
jgi:hypothetical protein